MFFHVFDWPDNNRLVIKGLNNKIIKSYPLANPEESLSLEGDKDNFTITLPENPYDKINSVIVLEISGDPDVDPFIVVQENGAPILLDYLSANTYGRAVKRFNRKGESGHFHISKMQSPEDYIEWHVQVATPGIYDVDLTYAAIPGWEDAEFIVESGREKLIGTVKSTDCWYEYKTERVGTFNIKKRGNIVFRIYPKNTLDHYLMYFRSIELMPAGSNL